MNAAFVQIWDHRVGAVVWNENRGIASFEYDRDFRNLGLEVAPLTMPLQSSKRIFEFVETRGNLAFKGLPGLLADTLPDKYGNALINAWLVQQGRPSDSLNPVETLCFIGARGMGALEFEPAMNSGADHATSLELNGLVDIAQKILSDREEFATDLNDSEERALFDILKIGTSAGGARAKALIAYNEQTHEVRSGQTSAPEGFEHWLLKFDGVRDSQFGASSGYGRVEMAYYHMAIASGINMMESRLLEEHDRAHFMTKRFDRIAGQPKAHVQTLCAMKHMDFNEVGLFSYEHAFETMRALRLSYPEAQEMFRRMVFNVVARNCDDHTKNFAFVMSRQGQWSLAPAYDVCHAYRPGSQWVSQHSLSIAGKRSNIYRDDLLFVAERMNIKNAKNIIDQVVEVVSRWDSFAKDVDVEVKLRKAIGKTHNLL